MKKSIKFLGGLLAAILMFPVGFALVYAFQAGCFLCFEESLAGGVLEIAFNVALLVIVIVGIVWAYIANRRG